MNSYRDFVLAQLEEQLKLEIITKEQFEIFKEKHLDELSQQMFVYAGNRVGLELEEELAYFSNLLNEVEQSIRTETRIVLKSRVPLPHLKSTPITHEGIFSVGGFKIERDGQEANVDWDNTLIAVNFDEGDYLVIAANLFGELDRETYQELNENVHSLIPYDEVYALSALAESTFTEIAYEAYPKDYDGDVIPMDVVLIQLARVRSNSDHALLGMQRVVEEINYDKDKLQVYNEREDVKWRLEGVRDPKVIHQSMGTYTSCLA